MQYQIIVHFSVEYNSQQVHFSFKFSFKKYQDDKTVNVFDMNDRGHRCMRKFNDYGCLSGTSIAVSNNSQFLATGFELF